MDVRGRRCGGRRPRTAVPRTGYPHRRPGGSPTGAGCGGFWGTRDQERRTPALVFHVFGVADVTFVADGELPPAFGAAPREDVAAVHCFHAGAEPVSLGPFAIIRLKSTFWHLIEPARAGKRSEAALWTELSEGRTFSIGSGPGVCQRWGREQAISTCVDKVERLASFAAALALVTVDLASFCFSVRYYLVLCLLGSRLVRRRGP